VMCDLRERHLEVMMMMAWLAVGVPLPAYLWLGCLYPSRLRAAAQQSLVRLRCCCCPWTDLTGENSHVGPGR
jgi:hypothetical protein